MSRRFLLYFVLVLAAPASAQVRDSRPSLQVVDGVNATGVASDQWFAILRRRLGPAAYDSVARIRKERSAEENAWRELIQQRAERWRDEIPALARLFDPVPAPARATIVLGNRGGEDAFTHDSVTIGFDLAALQANYGLAGQPANLERIDRFFRHEYTHLMQKAWLGAHPWPAIRPLEGAMLDIWLEGLGNYYSLSERWKTVNGVRSGSAARALAELAPRFVARMSALVCATPEEAESLMADMSMGRFDQKWGALPVALWLEEEQAGSSEALRHFVLAGPGGIWALVDRHLAPEHLTQIREARNAAGACG